MSIRTFAAIDVGSYELTIKIFAFSGKNNMREIDCVSKRLDLGSDTYAMGKISNEKMDELCRTLKDFSDIMKAYKVESYKAYGTSAIRETENTTIVQDQIAQRTGIKVETLSNSEQRFMDYKSVASKGDSFRKIIEEKTAILDIGGGSIQLSLFDNDTLVSTQNVRLGVLRIQDYLNRFSVKSSQMEDVIYEMAMARLDTYEKLYLKDRGIQNLIIVDDYLSPWAVKKRGGDSEKAVLDSGDFDTIFEVLRSQNPVQIASSMDIPQDRVPLVFISAVLIKCIAELMGVKRIWAPGVTLCDGIAYEYAEKIKMFRGEHDFEEDIVACAFSISKRYMVNRKRSETLDNIATNIFDSIRKIHGLGRRERLYLRLAAILHDCGKYISLVDTGENSFQIIMATEIIGLSHQEREIVANVVRFNHSRFIYDVHRTGGLEKEAFLVVAKLTAILRLASCLDRSHKQKLKGLKAVLKGGQLILTVDTQADIVLEKGFVEANTDFFKEVFSVEPVLKQRKIF
ncbi:Ppx/GppA phosphatase family protein [Acetatifactor aquisgranensis]|uniref:Ppx/GppA phosphatase family protein n=1 Tax=Acetatifactor aquisgranensis TaxID=2941233 RepID=UPI00203DF45B|nr:HD domain-containing protein [Acetatifactor aquisgranensis]